MPTTSAGIFRDSINNVAAVITALGLIPVTDPRNARPLTVFLELPTWDVFSRHVADVTMRLRILGSPPGNLDVANYLLTTAWTIMDSTLAVVSGAPSVAIIGSQELPAYDLVVRLAATYEAAPPPPPSP
jgi:hypothetical protein